MLCSKHMIRSKGYIELFKSYRLDYQDGEQKRDFIYVKDCADMIYWLLQKAEITGLYNIGSGQARSWNDVASAIFSALDQDQDIRYIDMPFAIKDQYQYFTQANMTAWGAIGGPQPVYTLESAIHDYVRAYLCPHIQYLT